MNIFLVDDEPLTAKWIESVLVKSPENHNILGSAGDGKQALEKIPGHPVDLVITDVKMPEMDGLELIRRLKKLDPGINILIISSHSDFRYTSEAIRLGADDYLLKSEMTEEDLQEALGRISAIRSRKKTERKHPSESEKKERESLNGNRKKALTLLLDEEKTVPESKKEALSLLCLDKAPVYIMLVRIKRNDELTDIKNIRDLIQQNRDLMGESAAVTAESPDLICITGQATSRNTAHPEKKILSGIKAIREQLENRFSLTVRYGLSALHSEATALIYREAETALDFHEFYSNPRVFSSGGISLTELQNNRHDLGEILEEVRREITLENYKYAWQLAEKILLSLGRERQLTANDARDLISSLFMTLETGRYSASRIRRIGLCASYSELESLSRGYLSEIENGTGVNSLRRNSSIENACLYIQEHYNDSQISLVSVSDHVGLNSTYLSDLFRKKMGLTFQDYLSGIRLEKAEYLLEHTQYSISEITEQVGFQSGSYFSRFFRKRHRLSPSEYRDIKTENRNN